MFNSLNPTRLSLVIHANGELLAHTRAVLTPRLNCGSVASHSCKPVLQMVAFFAVLNYGFWHIFHKILVFDCTFLWRWPSVMPTFYTKHSDFQLNCINNDTLHPFNSLINVVRNMCNQSLVVWLLGFFFPTWVQTSFLLKAFTKLFN